MIPKTCYFSTKKKIVLNSRKNPINGDRVVVCVIIAYDT
jgi:hypothetical protein